MSSNNHILTQDGKWVTVRNDELYHWKYIKREKVGDKWRYYYKDDKYDKSEAAAQDAKANVKRAESDHEAAVKKLQEATDAANDMWSKPRGEFDQAEYDRAWVKAEAAAEEEYNTAKAYEDAKAEFETAISKYDKAAEKYKKSAGHKVADALNNTSEKIDKAKDKARDYAVVQKARDVLGYDEKTYAEYAKKLADEGTTSSYVVNGVKETVDWGKEYAKAQEKFLKTPLGKAQQASEKIDKAKSYVSNLLKKKKSK